MGPLCGFTNLTTCQVVQGFWLVTWSPLEKEFTQKEFAPQEQILTFQNRILLNRDVKTFLTELPPLKVYLFPLKT